MIVRKGQIGRKAAGGFTLLELLLAFMVFALSFATVLEILSGSMRNTVRARHFTEAAMTAQSVMDMVGIETALQAGASEQGESGEYRWEIAISEYVGESGELDVEALSELTGITLLQVDLVVSWGEPGAEQKREFSTVKAIMAGQVPNGESAAGNQRSRQ